MESMVTAAQLHRTPQPIITELSLEDQRINQYVWYAGENLPWPEIKGGFIKRCRVTPIVPFPMWERINDVPQDMRKRLRQGWTDKDPGEAQYEIQPKGIFDSVMEIYGEMGVCELTALKGMEEQRVVSLNIDATFTPWHSDDIPKPYREIEDRIKETLRNLNGNQLLRSVGEEMLASIGKSRAYDDIFVDRVESQKTPVYSHPVFRALSRLERRRRDTAQNQNAELQNKVFEKIPDILSAQGTDPAIVELISEMRAQGQRQQQQIELLTQMVANQQQPRKTRQPNAE